MEEVKGKGTKSEKYKTPDRIEGLTNNCIRSLVTDADGHVWTGTSYGISRITPTVVNLSVDDGIPARPMMDCAAETVESPTLSLFRQPFLQTELPLIPVLNPQLRHTLARPLPLPHPEFGK